MFDHTRFSAIELVMLADQFGETFRPGIIDTARCDVELALEAASRRAGLKAEERRRFIAIWREAFTRKTPVVVVPHMPKRFIRNKKVA